jgi:carbon dioxide concentrating mechanism protein CcmO
MSDGQTKLAVGLLEVGSWTASMTALDAAERAGQVRVLQVELNDLLGASIKFTGDVSSVKAALDAAKSIAKSMNASVVISLIARLSSDTLKLIPQIEEFNPLLEQNVIHIPRDITMPDSSQAIGLIETQGFTAVIEAIDTACKAANVEIAGREKLGGGYICVVIRGDVAAVKAAVDAGKAKVEGLGKLVAAHVIARPSSAVLGLLPKA